MSLVTGLSHAPIRTVNRNPIAAVLALEPRLPPEYSLLAVRCESLDSPTALKYLSTEGKFEARNSKL